MSELQEIRQAIKRIEKKQDKILALLEPGKSVTSFNAEDWASTKQAVDLLGRSVRTLYRLRDSKLILCIKEGNEPRYFRPDIAKLKYRYMR
jgi:hypothetical protein